MTKLSDRWDITARQYTAYVLCDGAAHGSGRFYVSVQFFAITGDVGYPFSLHASDKLPDDFYEQAAKIMIDLGFKKMLYQSIRANPKLGGTNSTLADNLWEVDLCQLKQLNN